MNTPGLDTVLAAEEVGDFDAMQELIDSGLAWRLQGSTGRECMSAIENGHCTLGETGHRDYWGNYVPSRYEVQAGTKGSVEYAERMQREDRMSTATISYMEGAHESAHDAFLDLKGYVLRVATGKGEFIGELVDVVTDEDGYSVAEFAPVDANYIRAKQYNVRAFRIYDLERVVVL